MKNTRKQKRVQKRKGVRKTRKQTMKRIRGGDLPLFYTRNSGDNPRQQPSFSVTNNGNRAQYESALNGQTIQVSRLKENLFTELQKLYVYIKDNKNDSSKTEFYLKKLSDMYIFLDKYQRNDEYPFDIFSKITNGKTTVFSRKGKTGDYFYALVNINIENLENIILKCFLLIKRINETELKQNKNKYASQLKNITINQSVKNVTSRVKSIAQLGKKIPDETLYMFIENKDINNEPIFTFEN
jgi:hypothetical protein